MVMQLASLVRGDPDAYTPGVTREFYVADNDSGETWPITTIGDETVSTDHGYLTARHFMRLPRREGDKRRIDVWLAPSLGWLPARLVQTEPNGNQFELVWRGPLTVPAAATATNEPAPAPEAAANSSPDVSSGATSGATTATTPGAAPDTTSAQSATPGATPAAAPASPPQPQTQPQVAPPALPANTQTEPPPQAPADDAQPSPASPGPAPEHP